MRTLILALLCSAVFAVDQAHPAATTADWLRDAPAAAKVNNDLAAMTAASNTGISWAGWIAGAAGLVIGIGKFVPGVGGVVANVMDLVYKTVVPKEVHEAEQDQAALADGLTNIFHLIDQAPPDLKAKMLDRLPADAKDVFKAWLVDREQSAPPPVKAA